MLTLGGGPQVFGSVIGVIQTFPVEKAIVMRERAAKSYRV